MNDEIIKVENDIHKLQMDIAKKRKLLRCMTKTVEICIKNPVYGEINIDDNVYNINGERVIDGKYLVDEIKIPVAKLEFDGDKSLWKVLIKADVQARNAKKIRFTKICSDRSKKKVVEKLKLCILWLNDLLDAIEKEGGDDE